MIANHSIGELPNCVYSALLKGMRSCQGAREVGVMKMAFAAQDAWRPYEGSAVEILMQASW